MWAVTAAAAADADAENTGMEDVGERQMTHLTSIV